MPLTDFLLQRWPSFFSTSSVARRTVARGRVWMAEEVVQSGGAARKTNSLLLKIAIEIVDLPMKNMVDLSSSQSVNFTELMRTSQRLRCFFFFGGTQSPNDLSSCWMQLRIGLEYGGVIGFTTIPFASMAFNDRQPWT